MQKTKVPLGDSFSLHDEDEKKIEKYAKELENSNLVEDIKFREIAKSKEAIQEILRVILDEDDLIVIESIEQKDITESIFHGVILDCLCKLSTGEFVNIEMQIAFKNAPVKRMRYNQSAMTIAHSPKDKHFDYEKIPKIISIMFCEFDIFDLKEPFYEVKRKINDTDIIADNGIREIYINLKAKVKDKKWEALFDILTKLNYVNEQLFPKLTETKIKYSDLKKGGKKVMSGLTREIYLDGYASGEKRGEAKGIRELLIDQYKQNMVSKEYAANKLNISEEEFLELVEQ